MYNLYEMDEPILFSSTGKLHYVNCQFFEQDWKKAVGHCHDISELFFCLKGNGLFFVQDQEIPVSSQDFVFVDPYVEHAEWSSQTSPLYYICLGISGISLLPSGQNNGYFHSTFRGSSDAVVNILSILVKEVADKKTGYEEMCRHIMSMLLLFINRKTTLVSANTASAQPNGNHMIMWIHQFLTDNFTREINLDLLADKAGLNKYSLIRNFQKLYGITPIEYVLNLRFHEAKFLLKSTDHPIFQIAANLGFSSPNYFSQCFQKREGMSPKEYRSRNRLSAVREDSQK